jgi:hypothetical protein
MIVFDRYDYLTWDDVERNPYAMYNPMCSIWAKEDDRRLLLVALDKYAEALRGQILITRQQTFTWREDIEPNYEQIRWESYAKFMREKSAYFWS